MNFITYAPLKEQLRERTLSDRQALPYLIASTTIPAFLLRCTEVSGEVILLVC